MFHFPFFPSSTKNLFFLVPNELNSNAVVSFSSSLLFHAPSTTGCRWWQRQHRQWRRRRRHIQQRRQHCGIATPKLMLTTHHPLQFAFISTNHSLSANYLLSSTLLPSIFSHDPFPSPPMSPSTFSHQHHHRNLNRHTPFHHSHPILPNFFFHHYHHYHYHNLPI